MNRDAALDEAILHPDLRHINFFNGRLLTGGDLQAEQNVQHAHSRLLGRALGAGVAEGLLISEAAASPSGEVAVVVTAGLAVNRAGETLCLDCDQRVVFARPPDTAKRGQCVFADCEDPRGSAVIGNGTGYYLLTIASTSLREGRAPVSGLGNAIATCNSRYFSEGVMFRLLPLTMTGLPASAALAQSYIAQQCLGLLTPTPYELLNRASQGLTPAARGFETLVPAGWLTKSDVPLAVVEWTSNGIGFIDEWAVRRRRAQLAASTVWNPLIGDERIAGGEALFTQFQAQAADVLRSSGSVTRPAGQDFVALPPVGIIPVRGTNSPDGFDAVTFFGDQISSYYPSMLNAVQVASLLNTSFRFTPVALTQPSQFWVYHVIESQATGTGTSQLLLVFASREVPWINSYNNW